MNFACTCPPAAVRNGPGLVSLAANGLAQSASRYSASVSTQPRPRTNPGVRNGISGGAATAPASLPGGQAPAFPHASPAGPAPGGGTGYPGQHGGEPTNKK